MAFGCLISKAKLNSVKLSRRSTRGIPPPFFLPWPSLLKTSSRRDRQGAAPSGPRRGIERRQFIQSESAAKREEEGTAGADQFARRPRAA